MTAQRLGRSSSAYVKMHAIPWRNIALISLLVGWSSWVAPVGSSGQEINFAKQIRPLLTRNCISCHGPDETHREADLRLDSFEGASASAIVPGKPDESEVFRRVTSDDAGVRMPPPEHGSALTKDEQELIRRWIAAGAEYTQHWSFIQPIAATLPSSKFDDWTYNEIDRFIAHNLESNQLAPSEMAEPHQLIRRLALDLTGLPPTKTQVDRFAANPTIPTYETIVDELLASPTYGEHWAAMWLDLARYADSYGYASDEERTIWPWRDWAIAAFNQNMGYDQFTIEQLAGDLLPAATPAQQLATAFHRNTLNNTEGGTNDEEFRTIAVKDRINTTINVWMGLTMRCAECHTHKYDPISQTEYYQFLDFFNQTADADQNDDSPRLDVLSDERKLLIAKLELEIAALKEKLGPSRSVWQIILPQQAQSVENAELKINEDQSVSALGNVADKDDFTLQFSLPAGVHRGLKLEVMPEERTGNHVGRSDGGNFIISQILATMPAAHATEPTVKHLFSDAAADFSQSGYDVKLMIRDTVDDLGWAVAGGPGAYSQPRFAVMTFTEPIQLDSPSMLTITLIQQSPWPKHLVSRLRVAVTDVEQAAEKFRSNQLEPVDPELAKLETQKQELATPAKVPVLQELPLEKHRQSHVMLRGSFRVPGEVVTAAVPIAFHPLPDLAPVNRLGVAQWLLAAENPLTARVTVNRFWSRIFGRGIVETEEDFGSQGSFPAHPELLDWLAIDFREHGWNVKRLLKQLVMSATYRQTGQTSAQRLEIDPQNVFLSRGPRIRLTAEVVRDQALSVSGLLSPKMYGPPVFPPSPVKRIVNAFSGGMDWNVSPGEDRYRRAIYTYLKRSQPHPLFETFDMATREVCSLRRFRTNTPLQSFMTLNDETFVECAQHLAAKMQQHAAEVDRQIEFGLTTALQRPADPRQTSTLQNLYSQTLGRFANDATAASQMAGLDEIDSKANNQVAELAALTVVANVILNLDAFFTK